MLANSEDSASPPSQLSHELQAVDAVQRDPARHRMRFWFSVCSAERAPPAALACSRNVASHETGCAADADGPVG